MNPIRRTIILGAAAIAFVAAPLAGAYADDYYYYRHHWRPERHHDDAGTAVAAGILGLAAGAVIGSALTPRPAPVYDAPPPYVPAPGPYDQDYYPPAPAVAVETAPTVITIHQTGELEPWSPEWNRYCANRYPSFNPRTGTFMGYDGHDHFCVAP